MEILYLGIQVIIIIVAIVIFFLFKNSLPSYFSEKGKNLATKEDIAEITQTVKTVESQINVLTGSKLDYRSIKRKYILEYFAAYNNWDRTISNTVIDYSENNESINNPRIDRLIEAKHNYNLKEGEIELFINKDEFYKARANLVIPTLKYQHLVEQVVTDIKYANIDFNGDEKRKKISEILSEFRQKSLDDVKELRSLKNDLIVVLEKEMSELMND